MRYVSDAAETKQNRLGRMDKNQSKPFRHECMAYSNTNIKPRPNRNISTQHCEPHDACVMLGVFVSSLLDFDIFRLKVPMK